MAARLWRMDSKIKICIIISWLFLTCCHKPIELVIDGNIGKFENEIINEFGTPTHSEEFISAVFKDELRLPILHQKLNGDESIKIRELVYQFDGGVHFFWLTKNEHDSYWSVISDVYVPNEYTI